MMELIAIICLSLAAVLFMLVPFVWIQAIQEANINYLRKWRIIQ